MTIQSSLVTRHSSLVTRHDIQIAHLVRAVFPQHGYGGLERASAALTRYLLQLGAGVALFTRSWSPDNPPLLGLPALNDKKAQDFEYRAFGFRYSLLPLRANSIAARITNYPLFVQRMGDKVAAEIAVGNIDVVYAQGLTAFGVASAGRRRTTEGKTAPMIMNPQGMEDFKTRDTLKRLALTPFRFMYARGARAADRVVATDESTRPEVTKLMGVPPERVVVIPNGVDIAVVYEDVSEAQQAQLKQRFGIAPDDFVGLSVARLEANKGLPYLLRGLATLDKATPWRWIIVGSGKDRAALEQEAANLGIGERVVFAGSVADADLHNLYELCDLFGHATLYEGSSLVTLEAMAHARPVVATAAGGIPDKVLDGKTGFLVEPANAAAFGAAIARVMSNQAVAQQMGLAGRALVAEKFTWEQIAKQTLDLCRELKRNA